MTDRTGLSPADLFASLAAHFRAPQASTPAKGFGSGALKVDGKIFAALSKDELLLKLPRERVDALVASQTGKGFSTGAGRPKKEWITVPPTSAAQWLALAEEARAFVSAQTKASPRRG